MRKLLTALLIMSMMTTVSCSEIPKESESVAVNDGNMCYDYSSVVIDLFDPDHYYEIVSLIPCEDSYYLVVWSVEYDSEAWGTYYLYLVGSDGEISDVIDLPGDVNQYVSMDISNGCFLYTTMSNELVSVDIHTGEVTGRNRYDLQLCGVCSCEEGYVLLSVGMAQKYDDSGNLLGSVRDDRWNMFSGHKAYCQNGGKDYVVIGSSYFEADFDNGVSTLIFDADSLGDADRVNNCYGEFIFTSKGEYLTDLENSAVIPLAVWNEMDLIPESEPLASDPEFIGIDNERFAEIFVYGSGMAQAVIYIYNSEGQDMERIPIIVGGYNCSDDLSLRTAIYTFNISQSEYRAYIDDYNDNFAFGNEQEAVVARAALLQYFSEGNSPDIFYGNFFDYSSLAANGMTVGIDQYMNEETRERFDDITPNIKELMLDDNGNCYRLFSCYQLMGQFGAEDVINGQTDLSFSELECLADENGMTAVTGDLSCNIADRVIRYTIAQRGLFERDELFDILRFSYEHGYGGYEYSNPSVSNSALHEYVLFNCTIYSPVSLFYQEREAGNRLNYTGYPSLDSSVHLVYPFGQVAISSSSAHPQACADLIGNLLLPRVQDQEFMSCYIPVSESALTRGMGYYRDHDSIPATERSWYGFLREEYTVSDEAAEDFLSAVYSADTVIAYDWGMQSVIFEEVNSYYTEGRSIEDITDSLYARLELYLAEMG